MIDYVILQSGHAKVTHGHTELTLRKIEYLIPQSGLADKTHRTGSQKDRILHPPFWTYQTNKWTCGTGSLNDRIFNPQLWICQKNTWMHGKLT